MTIPTDELDLMVDALDLLGRLQYPQLVTITALMQAMLAPRKCRALQVERIRAHVEQVRIVDETAHARLTALLDALGGER